VYTLLFYLLKTARWTKLSFHTSGCYVHLSFEIVPMLLRLQLLPYFCISSVAK